MKSMLVVILVLATFWAGQDPKKPPKLPPLEDPKKQEATEPPADQRTAEPPPSGAQDPDQARQPPTDLIQHFPSQNPLVGVWAVHRIVRTPVGSGQSYGWIIFTKAFMSMHLHVSGDGPGTRPRFQSSMRNYRVEALELVTTSLLGARNGQTEGEILIEQSGIVERRRFLLVGPTILRIFQGPNAYIELRKIEAL